MTLLRRLGNKQSMAARLLPYFPDHDIYIEPFFGAGGVFFNKPRARHNFLNDMDNEVFNLYMVCLDPALKERLAFELARMPVHQSLWEHWKREVPGDPVMKAVRFLFYSNFGYMGKPDTLHMVALRDSKRCAVRELESIDFGNSSFGCSDFERFLRSITYDTNEPIRDKMFCYCDPPYIGTGHNYEHGDEWGVGELSRLFDVLEWRGCKYAVSEFDNPVVMDMAVSRGLQVHVVGERVNMKNRRVEILITNYTPPCLEVKPQLTLF